MVFPVTTTADECRRESLKLFRGTRNFFALHLVTATQAMGVCLERLTLDEQAALEGLSSAILAAHLVLAAPRGGEPKDPLPSLDEEHVIKYCWACVSEYRRTGDPIYLEEIRVFKRMMLIPDWAAAADL